MIDFFVMLARFFMAVGRSIKRERDARALFIFVIILLCSGTLFFVEVEHWSIVDGLYYCVTTLTTVGSGNLVPHTDAGKIFTVIYILMGMGAVLATAQILAKHAVAQAEFISFDKIREVFDRGKKS